ncbi:MAG TPA: hypothetical protein VI731_02460 [Bacteroidia bacterium]|nr:hypothetical protein [Bacteroidia bacterium]
MKRTGLFIFCTLLAVVLYQVGRTESYYPSKGKKDKKQEEVGCDTSKLVRTTQDSVILKKYQNVYSKMAQPGGVCYIIRLQRLGKLKKVSDSSYNIKIRNANTKQARIDWSTYLFCPIGKPNGIVTMLAENGDTVQQATYQNEKKQGWMIWWKKNNEILAAVHYNNDERKRSLLDTFLRGR